MRLGAQVLFRSISFKIEQDYDTTDMSNNQASTNNSSNAV